MWHSEQHRLAPTRFATHQKPVAAGSIVPTLRKPRRVGQPVIYFLPEEKIKMGQPPIASFVNGKFENGGDQNSGIFLYPGSTPGSFTLLDQFPNLPHPPGPRTLAPNSSYGHVVANSAQYYYVILVKP